MRKAIIFLIARFIEFYRFSIPGRGKQTLSKVSERRKHRRATYTQLMKVQAVASSKIGNIFEVKNEALNAYARDISEGGFGVNLSGSFKPGFILKVSFKVGEKDPEESEAYVRVVWSGKDNHGVQFLMLEDSTLRKIRVYIGESNSIV